MGPGECDRLLAAAGCEPRRAGWSGKEFRLSRREGDKYEAEAIRICESRGFHVVQASAGNQKSWDLLVNGMRLQVKGRSIDMTKPNNIRLVTNRTSSIVVYTARDVDAFAIKWDGDWYTFLATAIAMPDGQIRNGLYMPKVFHFRNMWSVLCGHTVFRDVQMAIPF